jgi:hypothetical protein
VLVERDAIGIDVTLLHLVVRNLRVLDLGILTLRSCRSAKGRDLDDFVAKVHVRQAEAPSD